MSQKTNNDSLMGGTNSTISIDANSSRVFQYFDFAQCVTLQLTGNDDVYVFVSELDNIQGLAKIGPFEFVTGFNNRQAFPPSRMPSGCLL